MTRAIRAAVDADQPVAGVKVEPDGSFVVMFGAPVPAPANDAEGPNPWDKLVS
jgi:hypothetical protein